MIVFNNVNFRTEFGDRIRIREVSRGILHPRDIPIYTSTLGGRIGRVVRGPRTIGVAIELLGNLTERREMARRLAKILDTDGLAKLQFLDEPDKVWDAIMVGDTDFDESARVLGRVEVEFLCPNPYASGAVVSKSVANGSTITNVGTAEALPKYTAKMTASASSISITSGGRTAEIVRELVAGSEVVIDSSINKIIIDGVLAMPALTLQSRFPILNSGENVVSFSGPLTLSVTYTERWK